MCFTGYSIPVPLSTPFSTFISYRRAGSWTAEPCVSAPGRRIGRRPTASPEPVSFKPERSFPAPGWRRGTRGQPWSCPALRGDRSIGYARQVRWDLTWRLTPTGDQLRAWRAASAAVAASFRPPRSRHARGGIPQSGLELVAHLALHPRRWLIGIPLQEASDRRRIVDDEFPQGPRHRLGHHVVVIIHQQAADLECAPCVPCPPLDLTFRATVLTRAAHRHHRS